MGRSRDPRRAQSKSKRAREQEKKGEEQERSRRGAFDLDSSNSDSLPPRPWRALVLFLVRGPLSSRRDAPFRLAWSAWLQGARRLTREQCLFFQFFSQKHCLDPHPLSRFSTSSLFLSHPLPCSSLLLSPLQQQQQQQKLPQRPRRRQGLGQVRRRVPLL